MCKDHQRKTHIHISQRERELCEKSDILSIDQIVKNERFGMYVQQMQQVQMDIEKVYGEEAESLAKSLGKAYS